MTDNEMHKTLSALYEKYDSFARACHRAVLDGEITEIERNVAIDKAWNRLGLDRASIAGTPTQQLCIAAKLLDMER